MSSQCSLPPFRQITYISSCNTVSPPTCLAPPSQEITSSISGNYSVIVFFNHLLLHTHTHTHTLTHTHAHTLTHTHALTHTHMHIHTHAHTHTHACTHTCTHTDTHTLQVRWHMSLVLVTLSLPFTAQHVFSPPPSRPVDSSTLATPMRLRCWCILIECQRLCSTSTWTLSPISAYLCLPMVREISTDMNFGKFVMFSNSWRFSY